MVDSLARELGISRVLARVLVGRGLATPDAARRFLWPQAEDLPDPFVLPDMDRAVKAILETIASQKRILVYGHDDTDGITATVLLTEVLRGLGAKVEYYLPDRYREGTGLVPDKATAFAHQGVSLVITVDCGVIDEVPAPDLRVIVVDHHEVSSHPRGVTALINPKRGEYPCRDLAGVGVAFKLTQALWQLSGRGTPRLLDRVGELVVLGTLADRVPLSGENRALTRLGLERIGQRPGLNAIAQVLGNSPEDGEFFWRGAVRLINSARSGDGWNPAVELLLTPDLGLALKLARDLYQASQEWEEQLAQEHARLLRRVEESDLGQAPLIAVVDEQIPVEMAGTCASRLTGRYNRPAMVLGFQEDRYFGEVRAPRGYDLIRLLGQARDLLIDYGGHLQAAGFSLFPENLHVFLRRVVSFAGGWSQDLTRLRRVDAQVQLHELGSQVVAEFGILLPYGPGNPRPLLLSRGVELVPLNSGEPLGRYRPVARVEGIEVLVEVGYDRSRLEGIFTSPVDLVYFLLPGTGVPLRIVLRDFRLSEG